MMRQQDDKQPHIAPPLQLFYCYAREDQGLRNELDKHLAGPRRSGLIISWHDGKIVPGTPWEQEIDIHLDASDIILLLVSPDFINSDYCYGKEMRRAIERHQEQKARVVPILVRSVYWQDTPFSRLQALPTDAKPVNRWNDRDEAFEDVTRGIYSVVRNLITLRQQQELKVLQPKNKLLPSLTDLPDNYKVTEATQQVIGKGIIDAFKSISQPSADRVVVIPAKYALDEYFRCSAYICQANRSFQPSTRMAFYTNNKIDRHIPKILGRVAAISPDEIETRTDLTESEKVNLRTIYEKMKGTAKGEDWNQYKHDVHFLTSPGSPETLILPQDIENDLTRRNPPHRRVAFTQSQRYVSLAMLAKGPKYTSELEHASSPSDDS